MKTKIEKVLRYLATGIFFVALALNVKFTLDSPYFLTGNELVAQTTGTGSDTNDTSNTGSGTGNDGYMQLERCWERSAFRITSISGTIGGGLSFNAGDILDTELEADAGASVSFERIDQYEITCPGTTIPQTVECQVREWENCSSSGCPCSV